MAGGINIGLLLEGLGGADNIRTMDSCATRLRLELKDVDLVNKKTVQASGAKGMIRTGRKNVHVIIGLKVQAAADALRSRL